MHQLNKAFFQNITAFAFFITLMATPSSAQTKAPKPVDPPKKFEQQYTLVLNNKPIVYRSVAQEIYIANDTGAYVGNFWCVAYLKGDLKAPIDATRPVTFIFNGGPGSASVWLHLGFFGPKIVQVDSDARTDDGPAPYKLRDNPHFMIEHSDLVFIDPIGTGFSKAIGAGKNEDFWGLNEDAASIAKLIRTWITENKRWQSPKFIAGESFGTTRAAAVANALEGGGQNLALNGLILISQALDYAGSTSVHDNITSYFTYLPAMAATAWYHKKAGAGKQLEDFVQEAREFAYNTYLPALYKGTLLPATDKKAVAERLSYFTGLPQAYVEKSDLKILIPRFRSELLRDSNLVIGQLDGRYFAEEIDRVSETPTLGDPADYQIESAFTAAMNDYLVNTLGVKMDRPYLTGNEQIYKKWNWKPVGKDEGWEPSYVNTAPGLAQTMRRNPQMKVMIASGYYDLITPFFDAEYTFSRHGFKPSQLIFNYYEAGHMMYNNRGVFEELAWDIEDFYKKK